TGRASLQDLSQEFLVVWRFQCFRSFNSAPVSVTVDSFHVELSCRVLMRLVLAIVTLFACGNGLFAAMPESATGDRFFEDKIRPLLINRCYECHSTESEKVKGGLKLDSKEAILKGGASGVLIVPGNSEKSLLIKAV